MQCLRTGHMTLRNLGYKSCPRHHSLKQTFHHWSQNGTLVRTETNCDSMGVDSLVRRKTLYGKIILLKGLNTFSRRQWVCRRHVHDETCTVACPPTPIDMCPFRRKPHLNEGCISPGKSTVTQEDESREICIQDFKEFFGGWKMYIFHLSKKKLKVIDSKKCWDKMIHCWVVFTQPWVETTQ